MTDELAMSNAFDRCSFMRTPERIPLYMLDARPEESSKGSLKIFLTSLIRFLFFFLQSKISTCFLFAFLFLVSFSPFPIFTCSLLATCHFSYCSHPSTIQRNLEVGERRICGRFQRAFMWILLLVLVRDSWDVVFSFWRNQTVFGSSLLHLVLVLRILASFCQSALLLFGVLPYFLVELCYQLRIWRGQQCSILVLFLLLLFLLMLL